MFLIEIIIIILCISILYKFFFEKKENIYNIDLQKDIVDEELPDNVLVFRRKVKDEDSEDEPA